MTKQIWQKKTKEIIQILKNNSSKNQASNLLKLDLRGKLFALEGICRLFLKSPYKQLTAPEILSLQDSLLKLKQMEDSLGRFSLFYEAEEFAGKHPKITQQIKKANQEIINQIKDQDWQSQILEINEEIQKIHFPKNELKTFKRNLEAEINRTRKKIHKLVPIINTSKYTYESLEAGLHEWRRSIRWISIIIQVYKQECELLPKKLKKYSELVKKYESSPFTQLGTGKVKINKLAYFQLSDMIKRIGEVKSSGEMPFFFKKYLWEIPLQRIEQPSQHLLKEWNELDILSNLLP